MFADLKTTCAACIYNFAVVTFMPSGLTNSKMVGESFVLKVYVWYVPTITPFNGFSPQICPEYSF